MKPNAVIPTNPLEPGSALAQAQIGLAIPASVTSPAFDVMTDLTEVNAAATRPSSTLRQAEQLMIFKGVRMLFVVSDLPAIEGIVTTTDLHGERQVRVIQERGLTYPELTVADVMTDLSMLDAMDLDQVRTANVGNVIATLKRLGRNHLLVVDRADLGKPCRVRGIFSRSQIERQIGSTITIVPIANTFAEIERALH